MVWVALSCLTMYLCFSDLCCGQVKNMRDKEEVAKLVRSSVMSKQYGNEDFLSTLITEACRKIFYCYHLMNDIMHSNKHKTLSQCYFNVEPPSILLTLLQICL